MQSERVPARRSAHQHECVDRGMSESCEAVENDGSDERGRPSRAPAKLADYQTAYQSARIVAVNGGRG
jgi:hypothetical protein